MALSLADEQHRPSLANHSALKAVSNQQPPDVPVALRHRRQHRGEFAAALCCCQQTSPGLGQRVRQQ